MSWSVGDCRELAEELLVLLPARWAHVTAVAQLTEFWVAEGRVPDAVAKAAWLHDVGYSEQLSRTGMHALDGARYLDLHGLDSEVVSLVAHHTGAYFEADERSMVDQLIVFDLPDQAQLDALTLADLVSGPIGERVTLEERFQDILDRYDMQHPVHRAVTRSRQPLEESARRAARRIGYPM